MYDWAVIPLFLEPLQLQIHATVVDAFSTKNSIWNAFCEGPLTKRSLTHNLPTVASVDKMLWELYLCGF